MSMKSLKETENRIKSQINIRLRVIKKKIEKKKMVGLK